MATPYPEALDDQGNIHIRLDGSFAGAPFLMRDAGRVIDISGTPLFFEIPALGFRRAFATHPADAKARWFPALTKVECDAISDGMAYVIWDESGGNRLDVFGAKIRRYS
jgi:hypothetical protein